MKIERFLSAFSTSSEPYFICLRVITLLVFINIFWPFTCTKAV